jgi:hypothetical protein
MMEKTFEFISENFPHFSVKKTEKSLLIKTGKLYALKLVFEADYVAVHNLSSVGIIQNFLFKENADEFIKLKEKLIDFFEYHNIPLKIIIRNLSSITA